MSPKATYWIKTLSKFVSVQLVVQALTIVSGLFLIRVLDQKQYAYYTIAISIQSTMGLLCTMGINLGLSAIGGKVWNDRYVFGQLIKTALQLRYRLASIWVCVITPILIWLLLRNGASISYAFLMVIMVLIGLYFELSNGVFLSVIRLRSQIKRIQKQDLVLATSRLILLGISYLTFLNAAVTAGVTAVSFGIQRFILGNWIADSIDTKAPSNQEYRGELLKIIKQSAPNVIYYCLQGQITVALITVFGNVESIAEVGALGRLAIIFSVLGSVMSSIVTPSFARCQSPKLLFRRYFQIVCTVGFAELVLISAGFFFPQQILWLLGKKYSHLQPELAIMIMKAASFSFVNTMWSLNASKAWLDRVWLQIPGTIAIQILLLFLLDFSTVKGAIIFGMAPLIPAFFSNAYMTYRGLKETYQAQ